jgi:hypothetical protein
LSETERLKKQIDEYQGWKQMNKTCHKWSDIDDQALLDAMLELEPLIEHYRRQGRTKGAWWDAVAGRLAPAVLVTGRACARRELQLRRLHHTDDVHDGGPSTDDAWSRVAAQVESYEQDLSEAIYDTVERIERKLDVICRELGVDD